MSPQEWCDRELREHLRLAALQRLLDERQACARAELRRLRELFWRDQNGVPS